jgi:hypothetical protein
VQANARGQQVTSLFAFAIWDQRATSRVLARDRVGKNPVPPPAIACRGKLPLPGFDVRVWGISPLTAPRVLDNNSAFTL